MTNRPRNVCPFCDLPAVGRTNFASTCMFIPSFFDEDGHEHTHDDQSAQWFMCENQHAWRGPLCWCGWGADSIQEPQWVEQR